MLRQSLRKKDVKDICYSRLHLFLFVGFLVDGPKKKTKIQLNIRKVVQSLHTHVPVLLCTTKLTQTRSQYYCVLQSLHKVVPSTTLYYKVCTKSFPVLLCTTKLAPKHFPVLLRFCSFPHRHGDVSAAKRTRFCSFPQRHGDARGEAEREVLQLSP